MFGLSAWRATLTFFSLRPLAIPATVGDSLYTAVVYPGQQYRQSGRWSGWKRCQADKNVR
jgi:small neutral amino acid transporter SnatA (MarC family)